MCFLVLVLVLAFAFAFAFALLVRTSPYTAVSHVSGPLMKQMRYF